MDTPDDPASLAELAAGSGDGITLALLSLNEPLLEEVQRRLADVHLLDPPADLFMGPVTSWAVMEFARLAGLPFENALSPAIARALLDGAPTLPSRPGDDLAGQLVRALERRGDWLCRHPDALTIAYVEHTEVDGSRSPARPDAFDDARFLLRFEAGGRPVLAGAWAATTRAGRDAHEDKVDPLGPPRLEPGQYKAWVSGRTAIGTKLAQDALVQVSPLPVGRDESGDYQREGDPRQAGLFVIDQHGSMGAPRHEVGDASAGCLVGQDQEGQAAFMAAVRTDARWQANNAYRFMTSLLTREQWEAGQG